MIVLGRLILAYRDFRHWWRFRKAGFFHNIVIFEGQRFSYYCEKSHLTFVDQRPTVVMLHGFLDRAFAFRHLIEPLQDHCKLIVIDLPGHGGSKLPPIRQLYTSQVLVRSLYRFILSVSPTPVHLFTHSLGGLIGLQMQLYAQSITGAKQFLSLCAIGPGALLLPVDEIQQLRRRFFPQTTDEVKQLLLELQQNAEEVKIPNFLLKGLLYRWSRIGFFYLSQNAMERPNEVWLTSKQLKECRMPVTLIWGDNDQIVPLEQGKKLKQSLKSSKLFVIKGGGHALLTEKTEIRSQISRIFQTHIDDLQ